MRQRLFVIALREVGVPEVGERICNFEFAAKLFVKAYALQVILHRLCKVALSIMKVAHLRRHGSNAFFNTTFFRERKHLLIVIRGANVVTLSEVNVAEPDQSAALSPHVFGFCRQPIFNAKDLSGVDVIAVIFQKRAAHFLQAFQET